MLNFFYTVSPVYELANNTLTMFAERCYGPTGALSSLLEPCCTIGPTVPLPLTILESFTAHAKFRYLYLSCIYICNVFVMYFYL